jgi:hypothetical protein
VLGFFRDTCRRLTMTIGELMAIIQTMDPNHEAFVALFTPDGIAKEFDIDAVRDDQGDAQLDIYMEEEVFDEEDGNGAVRREDTVTTPEADEAAAAAFLDFCERRGISEEEKDLIWNAMAFICYEQVQNRQGPFYEAIKPLLAEDEE